MTRAAAAAGALGATLLLAAIAPRAAAQDSTVRAPANPPPAPADDGSFFARVGLDRLRLSGVGVAVGGVKPSQMEATKAFTVEADYGEITPGWRVVFVTDVWSSRLDHDAIRRYLDALGRVVDDPSGDDQVNVGTVRVSDIALGVDTRWSPPRARSRSQFLRPYVGAGIVAHVLNGEGRAIANTFVERSLDNIAVGPAVAAGLDAVFFQHVTLGMQARYDLVSGARYGSLRALGTYLFDRAPARTPASGGSESGKRRRR